MAWNRIAGFQQAERSLHHCTGAILYLTERNGYGLVFTSFNPVFAGNFAKWFDRQAWSGVMTKECWGAVGLPQESDSMSWHSNIHTHRHTCAHTADYKPMACVSAAGWAVAHVLPRLQQLLLMLLVLVIHKLRLIPVVWCHLHRLPEGAVFNTGPLLFHRALCWGWALTCVLYLYRRVFICLYVCVCVLMCVCKWVRKREREQQRKSLLLCVFARPPTGLFIWSIVAERSWNTYLYKSHFPVISNTLAVKPLWASLKHYRLGTSLNCLDGVRDKDLNPLKLLVVSPDCSITLTDSRVRAIGKTPLNQSTVLYSQSNLWCYRYVILDIM